MPLPPMSMPRGWVLTDAIVPWKCLRCRERPLHGVSVRARHGTHRGGGHAGRPGRGGVVAYAVLGDDAGRGDLPPALPADLGSVPAMKPGGAFEPVGLVVSYGARQMVAVGTETGELRRFESSRTDPGTSLLSADGTALGVGRSRSSPRSCTCGTSSAATSRSADSRRRAAPSPAPCWARTGTGWLPPCQPAIGRCWSPTSPGARRRQVEMKRPLAWTADGEELLPFSEFDITAVGVATGERRTVVETGRRRGRGQCGVTGRADRRAVAHGRRGRRTGHGSSPRRVQRR